MIARARLKHRISQALRRSRAVALLGPRQCGKTTMAREFVAPSASNYFDLEDPESLARLDEPMTALKNLKGIVVIDEIQRRPDLFPILRVLCDRKPLPARFLILGSASPELLKQSSESLAGRLESIPLSGLSLSEVGYIHHPKHWLRGGLPPSYLAKTAQDSSVWRKNYILNVLERDIPQLGFSIPSATMLKFWTMLAHYNGQIWNAAEPARSLSLSEPTVRRYLDLMEGIFMVRQLRPWHENLKKRQVKSPKIYFRDTGLLHQLLGIKSSTELLSHPKCGASWEGYALEETIRHFEPEETYFWATHTGAELDLLMIVNGRRIGVEFKRADAPKQTPSMRIASEDLGLKRLLVIYPGERRYPLGNRIEALPLKELAKLTD
jgi:predicted AAA+ superfamily ATPase